jgi:prephenate dehydrogenase
MSAEGGFAGIRAAVFGLGLIGGSVARELAARGVPVLGWDRDAAAVLDAVVAGVVSRALGDDFAGIEEADVVILAVPVRAAPLLLARLAPLLARARLVTDAGSTKQAIVAAAEALGIGGRFVGAHPLAGHHRSGWAASRLGLFEDARVFLCPTAATSGEAMAAARALWTALGARPEVVDAAEHDRRLAWTSHLPQAVSSALGRVLADNGVPRAELGPGGRDVTRLAASSPEMWADVARDNAGALIDGLASAEAALRELREALERDDAGAILRFFADAQRWGRADEPDAEREKGAG